MADAAVVRVLGPDDLPAYKALRDGALAVHEDVFTSDAATEASNSAQDYVGRLGLDRARSHGLEPLTLSVTAGNPAERLYAEIGFGRYGALRRAIKLGPNYHDKHLMSLVL